jgi:UDP-2-acetamido-3-amino-2,3-dideoxy-glucuronate N-acetyltransferase
VLGKSKSRKDCVAYDLPHTLTNWPHSPATDYVDACAMNTDASLILPHSSDSRGMLVVAQFTDQVPFRIGRMFFFKNVPPGSERGHHAHRVCHELLVVPSGAVTIELDNGWKRWQHRLTQPDRAVHVPPMTWIVLRAFEADTICVVLASEAYDATDYIHDYDRFLTFVRGRGR